jgi:hypothetical protein
MPGNTVNRPGLWSTWVGELTKIHDVISANGTVVDNNVPGPERYSV